MTYTIASIKRVKIDSNRGISLFLEPAQGYRVLVQSKPHLLVMFNKDTSAESTSSLPITTEFKLGICGKIVTNMLPFWLEKRTLLKIIFSQITYTITSIEMYEDDEK